MSQQQPPPFFQRSCSVCIYVQDPIIREIGKKRDRIAQEVIIRWGMQHGTSVQGELPLLHIRTLHLHLLVWIPCCLS